MSCDVGKVTERLENELWACDAGEVKEGLQNELWRMWRNGRIGERAELILEPFSSFHLVTAHSPTLPTLYLCHSSISNPSVASPTSQLILQSFFRFFYVTGCSLMSPGEPPMKKETSIAITISRSDLLTRESRKPFKTVLDVLESGVFNLGTLST